MEGRNLHMNDHMKSQAYEAPHIVDYGDLQELTAACLGGPGADGVHPGKSNNTFGSSPAVGQGGGCVNGGP
jgi:hypothetical protein